MKQLLKVISILLPIIWFAVSCKKERKETSECLPTCTNGGDCFEKKCLCPPGYIGNYCEVYYSYSFQGQYLSNEPSNVIGNTLTITVDPASPKTLNFQSSSGFTFKSNLDKDSAFAITNQISDPIYQTEGNFKGKELIVTLRIKNGWSLNTHIGHYTKEN